MITSIYLPIAIRDRANSNITYKQDTERKAIYWLHKDNIFTGIGFTMIKLNNRGARLVNWHIGSSPTHVQLGRGEWEFFYPED